MADDTVTYTVVVNYTKNEESDDNYAKLKADIKTKLQEVNASLGTAQSTFVSIAEA